MKLSELLTYYRHRDGLSLESVGDFVGVSKSTVKRWESGESSNVPQARLDRLSELFGIDVQACLQGHVKPIPVSYTHLDVYKRQPFPREPYALV